MTNPAFIAGGVFLLLSCAALLGMCLGARLPQHHMSKSTKDAVRIGMGSVATMAALVLGLLVASAKGTYDTQKAEVIELSAKIVYLDHVLENYGAEASKCRVLLASAARSVLYRLWPESNVQQGEPPPSTLWGREMPLAIQELDPRSDSQRTFKSQAAELVKELGQMRWLLYEQAESSISTPMLVVMVFWLALTFISVGLFAPANATAVLAQVLGALSVAGAIFLILELDHSFSGFIRISSAPMLNALAQLVVSP
jgi:hypothetical protein